jgi:hypothetical protein
MSPHFQRRAGQAITKRFVSQPDHTRIVGCPDCQNLKKPVRFYPAVSSERNSRLKLLDDNLRSDKRPVV